jgi:ABC-type hemin transport system ATPase subunit
MINPGTQDEFSFSFNTLDFASSAHNVIVVIKNVNLAAQYRYFLIKAGCDSATQTQINGHHTIQLHNGFSWYPFSSGLAAITR